MKIQKISDIHGRFEQVTFDPEADIVLCCGDVSENIVKGMTFLKSSPAPVIFIPGNHEYYKNNFDAAEEQIKEICATSHGAITYANNDIVYAGDHRFICSSLWTDFTELDPFLVLSALGSMNDYYQIDAENFFDKRQEYVPLYLEKIESFKKNLGLFINKKNTIYYQLLNTAFNRYKQRLNLGEIESLNDYFEHFPITFPKAMFSPFLSYLLNHESKLFLKEALEKEFEGKTVVMTHHAPTRSALSMSRYAVDAKGISMLPILRRNVSPFKIGAYANSLEELVADKKIDAWCHGHLHDRMFYRLGSAAVHCNATGNIRNEQKRVGFPTYSFYADEETKQLALQNMLRHTRYITNKVMKFLAFGNQNVELFKKLEIISGITSEITTLLYTLSTTPEFKEIDFDFFQTATEIANVYGIPTKVSYTLNKTEINEVITALLSQLNTLDEMLGNMLDSH